MIKVTSQAASDLFFPDPADSSKGVLLERGPKVNVYDVTKLPPEVLKRFRIMAEDKHVLIETTEAIAPLDGLPAILPSEQAVAVGEAASAEPKASASTRR